MAAGSRAAYEGDTKEVTFLAPGSHFEVRMADNKVDTIMRAAQTLKARYFVCVDDWDVAQNCPVWAVFDMQRLPPKHAGEFVLPEPSKTFVSETNDGAVMWAAAMAGKS